MINETYQQKSAFIYSMCCITVFNSSIRLQGVIKPYKEVINVCWGDPHTAGVKPLSFVRQVMHQTLQNC